MNTHYDSDQAKHQLDTIFATRSEPTFASEIPNLADIELNQLAFKYTDSPPSDRLVFADENEGSELVLKIQGVLCASSLPPLVRVPAFRRLNDIRRLKQYVKITSLGSRGFQEGLSQLSRIEAMYQNHAKPNVVVPFPPIPYEGHPCLEAHARYFTDRNLVPYEKNIGFPRSVDPKGVLASIQPDSFIHGPDNTVEYARAHVAGDEIAYDVYSPAAFKAGDLVEIAFSCVGIPMKGGRRRLLLNLRAVTLLSDELRKESEVAMMADITPVPPTIPYQASKRRRLYVDMSKPDSVHTKVLRGARSETGAGAGEVSSSDTLDHDGDEEAQHNGTDIDMLLHITSKIDTRNNISSQLISSNDRRSTSDVLRYQHKEGERSAGTPLYYGKCDGSCTKNLQKLGGQAHIAKVPESKCLGIFAGLFAGIVAGFVIDARQDLQQESDQQILRDILQVLQNGSIMEVGAVPVSAVWVSGMWALSLYITLFGSIMGVLAKAWLAKFIPATTRREAADAYERFMLDLQAERWYLQEVLMLVPLLVQVASIIFLVGLVLRTYGDNLTVAHVLMSFCASGLLIYLTITFIPLIVPTAPFDTPFSDLFIWLKGIANSLLNWKPPPPATTPTLRNADDINEGLAHILYTKLTPGAK